MKDMSCIPGGGQTYLLKVLLSRPNWSKLWNCANPTFSHGPMSVTLKYLSEDTTSISFLLLLLLVVVVVIYDTEFQHFPSPGNSLRQGLEIRTDRTSNRKLFRGSVMTMRTIVVMAVVVMIMMVIVVAATMMLMSEHSVSKSQRTGLV